MAWHSNSLHALIDHHFDFLSPCSVIALFPGGDGCQFQSEFTTGAGGGGYYGGAGGLVSVPFCWRHIMLREYPCNCDARNNRKNLFFIFLTILRREFLSLYATTFCVGYFWRILNVTFTKDFGFSHGFHSRNIRLVRRNIFLHLTLPQPISPHLTPLYLTLPQPISS